MKVINMLKNYSEEDFYLQLISSLRDFFSESFKNIKVEYNSKRYKYTHEVFYKFSNISQSAYDRLNNKNCCVTINHDWFKKIKDNGNNNLYWDSYTKEYKPGINYFLKHHESFIDLLIEHLTSSKYDDIFSKSMKTKIKSYGDDLQTIFNYLIDTAYLDYCNILKINADSSQINKFILTKLEILKTQYSFIQSIKPKKCTIPDMYYFELECNVDPLNLTDSKKFIISLYTGNDLTDTLIQENFNSNYILNILYVMHPEDNFVNNEYLIKYNIYIEPLKDREILNRITSESFLYENELDCETVISLNRIIDTMIYRFSKYTNILLRYFLYKTTTTNIKNATILFDQNGYYLDKKPIDLCQIDFEKTLIEHIIKKESYQRVVLFGQFGLSSIIDKLNMFNEIIILSDSQEYVNVMTKLINESKKIKPNTIKCMVFYSGISNTIFLSENLINNVDLIIMGNGTGSTVSNIKKYLLFFNIMLKPGGKLIFSCINKFEIENNFINNNASYYFEKNQMFYEFSNEIKWKIYSKTYTERQIKNIINNNFTIDKIYNFPATKMVCELNNDDEFNQYKQINTYYTLSNSEYKTNGYYFYIVATKDLLNNTCIENNFFKPKQNEIINHNFVYNRTLQYNVLKSITQDNINPFNLLKILILKDQDNNKLILCIPSIKSLKMTNGKFNFNNNQYTFATIFDLNKLGFQVGNISPFILKNDKTTKFYYDEFLNSNKTSYYYFGDNNGKITYKIEKENFIKLLKKFGYTASDSIDTI